MVVFQARKSQTIREASPDPESAKQEQEVVLGQFIGRNANIERLGG